MVQIYNGTSKGKTKGEGEKIMETNNTSIIKNTSETRITINKLSKGYNWTIALSGDKTDEIIDELVEVDKKLIRKFLIN